MPPTDTQVRNVKSVRRQAGRFDHGGLFLRITPASSAGTAALRVSRGQPPTTPWRRATRDLLSAGRGVRAAA